MRLQHQADAPLIFTSPYTMPEITRSLPIQKKTLNLAEYKHTEDNVNPQKDTEPYFRANIIFLMLDTSRIHIVTYCSLKLIDTELFSIEIFLSWTATGRNITNIFFKVVTTGLKTCISKNNNLIKIIFWICKTKLR